MENFVVKRERSKFGLAYFNFDPSLVKNDYNIITERLQFQISRTDFFAKLRAFFYVKLILNGY